MNKADILEKIILKLSEDLKSLIKAAKDAHATATHEETAAESKYDTFALEASYLAHGQAKRAEEIKVALDKFKAISLRTFTNQSAIQVSALVTLENEDGDQRLVFVGPLAGGTKIESEGQTITVITPESPMGQALVGKMTGDEIELRTAGTTKDYQILSVF